MTWMLTTRRAAMLVLMLVTAICIATNTPPTAQASTVAASSNDCAFESSQVMLRTAAKSTYEIAFRANGGKGAMKAQTVKRDTAVALSANKFTRAGYRFAGWNTKANGKGKTYKNKAKVKNLAKAGKTVTLYAQWKKSATAYVKVSSASFGANNVAGAMFQVISYQTYSGNTKYKITMNKNGTTKTLVSDAGNKCITNGRYLFYSKPLGTRQYVSGIGSSIEKTAIYRLDIRTGSKKKLASGSYQSLYGCNGKYLYFGESKSLMGEDLYAFNLNTKKKKLMATGVADATYSRGYVITAPHHNIGINLPVYSFKANGTGKKTIAKALDVRVLKNRVYYIVINDNNPMQYRKYSCSLRGKGKRAVTAWGGFHDVEFPHDMTKA